jgi:hypothetical protein
LDGFIFLAQAFACMRFGSFMVLPQGNTDWAPCSARHMQDVVQRIGSKGPLADFARALCARLSPQLIAAPHVAELLRMAAGKGDGAADEALLAGVLALLVDIADAAPTLFQGAVPQVGGVHALPRLTCMVPQQALRLALFDNRAPSSSPFLQCQSPCRG